MRLPTAPGACAVIEFARAFPSGWDWCLSVCLVLGRSWLLVATEAFDDLTVGAQRRCHG